LWHIASLRCDAKFCCYWRMAEVEFQYEKTPVCTENLIRVDDVVKSLKLAE